VGRPLDRDADVAADEAGSMTAPPQDLAAEEAILGTVLLGPKTLTAMIGSDHGLRPEHFYRDDHARLFSCMIGLHERGDGVDTVTLRAEAKRLQFDAKDIDAVIDYSMVAVPDVTNWPSYVKAVKAAFRRRQILQAAHLLADAAEHDKPALIAEAERLLAEHEANASVYTPEQQADDFLEGNLAPVISPWPWWGLNELTGGGLRASQTTFVFAWTNHGKSPAVDEIILTAHDKGLPAALYINEMGQSERAMRFAAQLTDVGFERIRDNELTPGERAKVANALASRSIPILNVAGWTSKDVCRDIERSGWRVAGIDGLHMFAHENESDLTRMVTDFAQCAKRTGCHIIIAGHLNMKRAEGSELPPPVLRDIRGSGMIMNVADFIIFLHRQQTEDGFPVKNGGARLWIAKARNSSLGDSGVRRYDGNRMRFVA
jgi:replicative DNA helicase